MILVLLIYKLLLIVFSGDFNNSISWGTNFIDVSVTDSNNLPVAGALVTLLKGDDEIFTSVLTNNQGLATIFLDYESTGEVYLTITKRDCRNSRLVS